MFCSASDQQEVWLCCEKKRGRNGKGGGGDMKTGSGPYVHFKLFFTLSLQAHVILSSTISSFLLSILVSVCRSHGQINTTADTPYSANPCFYISLWNSECLYSFSVDIYISPWSWRSGHGKPSSNLKCFQYQPQRLLNNTVVMARCPNLQLGERGKREIHFWLGKILCVMETILTQTVVLSYHMKQCFSVSPRSRRCMEKSGRERASAVIVVWGLSEVI